MRHHRHRQIRDRWRAPIVPNRYERAREYIGGVPDVTRIGMFAWKRPRLSCRMSRYRTGCSMEGSHRAPEDLR